MINKKSSNVSRVKRHLRVRKNISGTQERPRLNVYRSLKNIYAQVIDDETGKTLVSASSLDKELGLANGGNKDAAKAVARYPFRLGGVGRACRENQDVENAAQGT